MTRSRLLALWVAGAVLGGGLFLIGYQSFLEFIADRNAAWAAGTPRHVVNRTRPSFFAVPFDEEFYRLLVWPTCFLAAGAGALALFWPFYFLGRRRLIRNRPT